jgi:hypothetical protein
MHPETTFDITPSATQTYCAKHATLSSVRASARRAARREGNWHLAVGASGWPTGLVSAAHRKRAHPPGSLGALSLLMGFGSG